MAAQRAGSPVQMHEAGLAQPNDVQLPPAVPQTPVIGMEPAWLSLRTQGAAHCQGALTAAAMSAPRANCLLLLAAGAVCRGEGGTMARGSHPPANIPMPTYQPHTHPSLPQQEAPFPIHQLSSCKPSCSVLPHGAPKWSAGSPTYIEAQSPLGTVVRNL